MTEVEKRLWTLLRGRGVEGYKFRRQRPIGPFIADFACIEEQIIIEVDGGQHADNAADERRTAWLAARGWRVLRFWNHDVLHNIDGVHRMLVEALGGAED
jgi:very-short-patch-repair endonuclease